LCNFVFNDVRRLPGGLPVAVIYCPKLPVSLNATLSTVETVYDTTVIVQCNSGFKLTDGRTSKTVLCLHNATWNDTAVDCQGF